MPDGTTLANAYIQILPTTKGIKGNLEKELNGAGTTAGGSAGGKFSGAFTKAAKFAAIGAAAGAAIGAGIGKSLKEGANLEQSIGGVETLFKKNADDVIKNADKAWKTAGLSANQYMEQSTSFAASLLQSLDGDTKKAAGAADQAIIDMADNANKMGTDIESIQNAYQGFAKQNYTMLDNLKLGYGGTKEEMERLLKDAGKITGQKYDLSNLADVYEAIHVVQGELDITGTTAKEGASTLAGSFAAMKSSVQNFMGDLALGRNIGPAMTDLVTSTVTFISGNLIPAIGRVFKSLPKAIKTFLKTGLPKMKGMGKALLKSFAKGADGFVDEGASLLQNIAKGIAKFLPKLVKMAPVIIGKLADFIGKNEPKLLKTAGTIMITLAKGVIKSIPLLIKAIPQIFKSFLKMWKSMNWLSLGKMAINALKNGMGAILKTIGPYVRSALGKVKSFILSPFNAARSALSSVIKGIKDKVNLSSIAGKIKSGLSRVKDAITSPFTSAKEKLSGIIEKVKGLFPIKFSSIISRIHIPKLKLDGGKAPYGFMGKGKLPSLKWAAKAMDQPYTFTGATLFGAGEAGDEVLYGRESLLSDIADAVRSVGGSGGTLQLVINLDGKTIGKATVDYMNNQTIMFGTNPILV